MHLIAFLGAVLAQTLDMVSLNWDIEMNPVALSVGPLAYVGKAAVMVLLGIMVYRIPSRSTLAISAFAILIGMFGFASNGGLA